MDTKFPKLTEAIHRVGIVDLAAALGVTYQAVRKWERAGRLPRTEWTGETNYTEKIVSLVRKAGGRISRADLLPPAGGKRAA